VTPLLTSQEAAGLLGIAVATLHNWRSRKRGPVYLKIGGSIKYRLSDIEKFLVACELAPDPVRKAVFRPIVREFSTRLVSAPKTPRFGGHRTKADRRKGK
jgi:predicted DNA-binding transcriptional regulator AlpA